MPPLCRRNIIFKCRLFCRGGLGVIPLQIHPGCLLVGRRHDDHRWLWWHDVRCTCLPFISISSLKPLLFFHISLSSFSFCLRVTADLCFLLQIFSHHDCKRNRRKKKKKRRHNQISLLISRFSACHRLDTILATYNTPLHRDCYNCSWSSFFFTKQ